MCGQYGRRGDKQRIAEWMQNHNISRERYEARTAEFCAWGFIHLDMDW